MSKIPQVRRIEFGDQQIGMGFNSQTGLTVGTALEGFEVSKDANASGQQVSASISIVETHEDLMSRMGMSFSAQGRYGFVSGSAKAEFAESSQFNSTSTFLIARCVVQNPFTRGRNFRVTEVAHELLTALRTDDFSRAFGDSFIRGIQTGGEYYCVIRITSVSRQTQDSLAAELQMEANGLIASGDFKLKFEKANQSASSRSEYSATMLQRAGSGTDISPTVEIAEALARYKAFPAIAATDPVAYEAEVATYDTIPLPVPTAEEQDNFVAALADAREKKLRYIQIRNDIDFARRNREFFVDLPEDAVLIEASSAFTGLLNAVVDHAVRLSRGQIRPPQFFDPAMLPRPLKEPEAIPLVRADKVGNIPVVSLIGLRRSAIERILAAPKRTLAEYRALEVPRYEPGTRGILPTDEQYALLSSGIKFVFTERSSSKTGVRSFWSWVLEQDPVDGRLAEGDTITLTSKMRGAGGVPPELRDIAR